MVDDGTISWLLVIGMMHNTKKKPCVINYNWCVETRIFLWTSSKFYVSLFLGWNCHVRINYVAIELQRMLCKINLIFFYSTGVIWYHGLQCFLLSFQETTWSDDRGDTGVKLSQRSRSPCDLVHITFVVQKIIVSLEILINPEVMCNANTVEMVHLFKCFIQIFR